MLVFILPGSREYFKLKETFVDSLIQIPPQISAESAIRTGCLGHGALRWTFHSLPGQLIPFQYLSILIMKFVFLVFGKNYFALTHDPGFFFFMMHL